MPEGKRRTRAPSGPAGVVVAARTVRMAAKQEKPDWVARRVALPGQRSFREEQGRLGQVADGPVVPMKRGNARRGKRP